MVGRSATAQKGRIVTLSDWLSVAAAFAGAMITPLLILAIFLSGSLDNIANAIRESAGPHEDEEDEEET